MSVSYDRHCPTQNGGAGAPTVVRWQANELDFSLVLVLAIIPRLDESLTDQLSTLLLLWRPVRCHKSGHLQLGPLAKTVLVADDGPMAWLMLLGS